MAYIQNGVIEKVLTCYIKILLSRPPSGPNKGGLISESTGLTIESRYGHVHLLLLLNHVVLRALWTKHRWFYKLN